MNKIIFIILGLVILYSITIILPVYCGDYLLSEGNVCYWFYNKPVIAYGALIVLLIVLNGLVKLIRKNYGKKN